MQCESTLKEKFQTAPVNQFYASLDYFFFQTLKSMPKECLFSVFIRHSFMMTDMYILIAMQMKLSVVNLTQK